MRASIKFAWAMLFISSSHARIIVPVPAWDSYFRNPCNLYFVHIGANCGTSTCSGSGGRSDPVWEHQARYNWRGAVVEANPLTFRELQRNYAPFQTVKPINVAISNNASDVLDFWCPFHAGWTSLRLSEGCTTNRGWAHRGLGLHDLSNPRHHMQVKAMSINDLWSLLTPSRVDVLIVDVEGSEHDILGAPLPDPKPAMIFFESSGFIPQVNPRGEAMLSDVRDMLKRQGYEPVKLGDPMHDGWEPLTSGHNWKDDLWWRPGHPSLGIVRDEKCAANRTCIMHTRHVKEHPTPSQRVGCVCAASRSDRCRLS